MKRFLARWVGRLMVDTSVEVARLRDTLDEAKELTQRYKEITDQSIADLNDTERYWKLEAKDMACGVCDREKS